MMFVTGTLLEQGHEWAVMINLALWTLGEMLLFPGMSAYVAEISPPQRRGAWMGWFTMSFNAGFAVGPLLGTMLMEAAGAAVLWWVALALGLLSAVVYTRVYEPSHLARQLKALAEGAVDVVHLCCVEGLGLG